MTHWFDWMGHADAWVSLFTLTLLEIVLGIDNLIFISILSGKLPLEQQARARRLGLSLALVTRILLLLSITWVMSLSQVWWQASVLGLELPNTGKDFVLAIGGLFLVWKSVHEIHEKLEGDGGAVRVSAVPTLAATVVQILLLDIVFSLDSVITAVGTAQHVPVMVTAVIAAMLVMLFFVDPIGGFVERHPSVKVLALSFLILIGTLLLAEGFHQHFNKGYVYFAMAFAVGVEMLNLRVRKVTAKGKSSPPHR